MSVVDSVLARLTPAYDSVVAFHTANIDALVKANGALVSGVQAISHEVITDLSAQIETVAVAAKQALDVKSFKDATDLVLEGTKGNYTQVIAKTTKLGEMSVKTVNEALAPVTARVEAIFKRAA